MLTNVTMFNLGKNHGRKYKNKASRREEERRRGGEEDEEYKKYQYVLRTSLTINA